MTQENYEQPEKLEVELTEDALEQVSGGFNPQPDPPAKLRLDKWNQHLSQELLPAVKVMGQKV